MALARRRLGEDLYAACRARGRAMTDAEFETAVRQALSWRNAV